MKGRERMSMPWVRAKHRNQMQLDEHNRYEFALLRKNRVTLEPGWAEGDGMGVMRMTQIHKRPRQHTARTHNKKILQI